MFTSILKSYLQIRCYTLGGDVLKIVINEDSAVEETEIIINCKKSDDEIFKMLAVLCSFDRKLTGTKDGRTFIIDAVDVMYCDSVDKKTFIYTKDGIYETPLRLYELEERLSHGDFFRASKQNIINISKIVSMRPEFSGKIEVTLQSGERLYVSRQYVPTLKSKLGM